MNIKNYMLNIGDEAKKASFETASATNIKKNKFVNNLGKRILANESNIIASNKKDLIQAKKNQQDDAFIDRLTLNKKNIIVLNAKSGFFNIFKKFFSFFITYKWYSKISSVINIINAAHVKTPLFNLLIGKFKKNVVIANLGEP